MKIYYQSRCLMLTFITLLFCSYRMSAQHSTEVVQGVVRVKVSKELGATLERSRMSLTKGNILQTGYAALDQVNRKLKVNNMQRVFRHAGRFEAKHRQYGLHLWYEIKLSKEVSLPDALRSLGEVKDIIIAEPVHEVSLIGGDIIATPVASSVNALPGPSNDPLLNAQWHYHNTGQTGGRVGADIKLIDAWSIETGRNDVVVAVMDHGIDVNHPDLASNIWTNPGEIPGNNIDDDNNGYVDDVHGYGFAENKGSFTPGLHGTHVAGTIAATNNNGIGVAGIAGGSGNGDGAKLMSCAVFGPNRNSGFAESFVYAADMGAVISQNSWSYRGLGYYEQAVLDAIDYFIAEAGMDASGSQSGPMAGGVAFFSAGNSNIDGPVYPAYYPATVAVASTIHNDTKAYYSCFGNWVDIASPGGETIVPEQGVLSTALNGQYAYLQGTSMACPHASGVAALIASRFGGPGFSPQVLKARLIGTADPIDHLNPGYEGLLGYGRLNAFAALQDSDNVPPNSIQDVQVRGAVGEVSATLQWTAPADPSNSEGAAFYDIRYSTSPIDELNFSEAQTAANTIRPGNPGTMDTIHITGLDDTTRYYFAVKAIDIIGNISEISNVPSITTLKGKPVAVIQPTDIVDFGTVFLGSKTYRNVVITNAGTDELIIEDVIENHPLFTHWVSGNIVVEPLASYVFLIEFTANTIGMYDESLIIHTSDPANSVHELRMTVDVLKGPPVIEWNPVSITQAMAPGVSEQPVTISNTGESELQYQLATRFTNTGSQGHGIKGRYSGLEEFPLGNITGQTEWSGSSGVLVEDENPFRGNQHLRLTADDNAHGQGRSAGFYNQSKTMSSLTMMMNLDNAAGGSWIFNFTSPNGFVTLLSIEDDGTMNILTDSGDGVMTYQPIMAEVPSGYFEFRIDVERSTALFKIYYNGDHVFEGKGRQDYISRLEFQIGVATGSPFVDIDELTIWNGQPGWFTLSENGGAIPEDGSNTVTVTFDARGLAEGIYEGFIDITTNIAGRGTIAIPVRVEVGDLTSIHPDHIQAELTHGEQAGYSVTVQNYSTVSQTYSINRSSSIGSLPEKTKATDFESFTAGPVSGQSGWYGQGNWIVDTGNPFSGNHHLRFLSTGSPQIAQSPSLYTVTSPLSSLTMMINLDGAGGSDWTIAPQSGQGIVTLINIAQDGTMRVQDFDELGNGTYHVITQEPPSGYFELGIDVVQATLQFNVYFNRQPVFFGRAKNGNISNVFFVAHSQTQGSVLDIDNYLVKDRLVKPWMAADNAEVTVPPGSSADILVTLTAADLLQGIYHDQLILYNQQTDSPDLTLPVTLEVKSQQLSGSRFASMPLPEETTSASSVRVYPVPSSDVVMIRTEVTGDGRAALTLINSLGKVVYLESVSERELDNKQLSLQRIGLSQGVYLLMIKTAQCTTTQRIIKQ